MIGETMLRLTISNRSIDWKEKQKNKQSTLSSPSTRDVPCFGRFAHDTREMWHMTSHIVGNHTLILNRIHPWPWNGTSTIRRHLIPILWIEKRKQNIEKCVSTECFTALGATTKTRQHSTASFHQMLNSVIIRFVSSEIANVPTSLVTRTIHLIYFEK